MSEDIFRVEARPKSGKELPRVDFSKSNLSDKEISDFEGICQLGVEQLIDCYSIWNEKYNPFDIVSMCGGCKYRLENIKCESIVEFSEKLKIFGGEFRYPEFIAKQYGKYINLIEPLSFVYFVTDGHFVKIGKANLSNINRRKMQLQTGNSQNIFYIALIPCKDENSAHELEFTLHKIYQQYHVAGEWYSIKDHIDIKKFHEYWNPSNYIDEPQITVEDYCKK